ERGGGGVAAGVAEGLGGAEVLEEVAALLANRSRHWTSPSLDFGQSAPSGQRATRCVRHAAAPSRSSAASTSTGDRSGACRAHAARNAAGSPSRSSEGPSSPT